MAFSQPATNVSSGAVSKVRRQIGEHLAEGDDVKGKISRKGWDRKKMERIKKRVQMKNLMDWDGETNVKHSQWKFNGGDSKRRFRTPMQSLVRRGPRLRYGGVWICNALSCCAQNVQTCLCLIQIIKRKIIWRHSWRHIHSPLECALCPPIKPRENYCSCTIWMRASDCSLILKW